MKQKVKTISICLLGGILAGTLSGFFGGGGGLVVLPILTYLFDGNSKLAHANSILVILPVTVVSSLVYLNYVVINEYRLIWASVGVFLGGILGAYILPKLKVKIINIIFGLILTVVGFRMTF